MPFAFWTAKRNFWSSRETERIWRVLSPTTRMERDLCFLSGVDVEAMVSTFLARTHDCD
jgi:hypothetical protein